MVGDVTLAAHGVTSVAGAVTLVAIAVSIAGLPAPPAAWGLPGDNLVPGMQTGSVVKRMYSELITSACARISSKLSFVCLLPVHSVSPVICHLLPLIHQLYPVICSF